MRRHRAIQVISAMRRHRAIQVIADRIPICIRAVAFEGRARQQSAEKQARSAKPEGQAIRKPANHAGANHDGKTKT
jgi:tRNA(Met) C34 N-acetyltransferase TmcA